VVRDRGVESGGIAVRSASRFFLMGKPGHAEWDRRVGAIPFFLAKIGRGESHSPLVNLARMSIWDSRVNGMEAKGHLKSGG
jgi:hypothetical protein